MVILAIIMVVYILVGVSWWHTTSVRLILNMAVNWLTGCLSPTELTGFQFTFWNPYNISRPPFAADATSVVVAEFRAVIYILISVLLYRGVTYWRENQITRSEIRIFINAVFFSYLLADGQIYSDSFSTYSCSLTFWFHFEYQSEI
jgi:hypothetical protein